MKWLAARPARVDAPRVGFEYGAPDDIGTLYYSKRFGLDDVPGTDTDMLRSPRAAFREVLGAGALVRYMPRLPSVLPRLIALLRDPDASVSSLVALLLQDPTLVARVLSIANSPYFRRSRRPLEDLNTAVIYLGEEGMRALVNATVMQPILTVPQSAAFRAFSDEIYGLALATAELARLLAEPHGFHPSMQHLTGLLHATGEASILAFALRDGAGRPVQELQSIAADLCQGFAGRATSRTAAQWSLGEEIEVHLECGDDGVPLRAEADFAQRVLKASQLRWLFAIDSLPQHTCEELLEEIGLPGDVLTMLV